MLDSVLRDEPRTLVLELHQLGRAVAWAFGNGHGPHRRLLQTFAGGREREHPGIVGRNLGSHAHNGFRHGHFDSVAFVLPHFQANHRKADFGDEFVRGGGELRMENGELRVGN